MFSHLESLEHYCFKNIRVRHFSDPVLQECISCGLSVGAEVATQAGLPTENAPCPNCKVPMSRNAPEATGEAHADLCLSKYAHYSHWVREGKITPEEYANWVKTLTPREKAGHYQPAQPHKIVVPLNEADMTLISSSPADFRAVVIEKLKARADLFIEHDLQKRKQLQELSLPGIEDLLKK